MAPRTSAGAGRRGASWTRSNLPGLTSQEPANPNSFFERVSDTTVAYGVAHNAWLISSIPLQFGTLNVPTVFVSRSTDDGLTFSNPVAIPPPPVKKVDLDKNWTVCDNTGGPFDGRCYTEFDNFGEGDLEYMSTSTDGGADLGDARSSPPASRRASAASPSCSQMAP